jgi:ribonucleoside-diphosphate reductase alpha chain
LETNPEKSIFRTKFSENVFKNKYAHEGCDTWEKLSSTLIKEVCKEYLSKEDLKDLIMFHSTMKFIAGGRYLYYAGRANKFYNNCYLLKAEEDSREDWANLSWKSESCLLTGGGIGVDYSAYRPEGTLIKKTGGRASGPIPKMKMINEIGRNVMQGGSRRSALYASLNWRHKDISSFLHCKDWYNMPISGAYNEQGINLTVGELKERDFNYPAPLDMTNISVNYDNSFLETIYDLPIAEIKEKFEENINMDIKYVPSVFIENCRQALKTAEPGFSFNFFDKNKETLRNACTEVVSEDDSDVCNLGSLNMSKFDNKEEFKRAVELASKFLLCGTLKAKLPYEKIYLVREKNRRLGLGLMGIHEWLLQRGYKYEVVDELKEWLQIYKEVSERAANELASNLDITKPIAYRAIAPTGTIGILAGTTTGIEPLFAVAYKRRYLKGDKSWHYQFVVDGTAKFLIEKYGINPERIESALDLAKDFEKRIKFQADVQDYVDMSISSTINIPKWGTELNNETRVKYFADILLKYAHRLRGFTCYPDGSRGGQPLTPVSYSEAKKHEGKEFKEEFHDICDISGGGTCGI